MIKNSPLEHVIVDPEILADGPEIVPHFSTGCRLSTKKLADAGVKLRPVEEAVEHAIKNWQ